MEFDKLTRMQEKSWKVGYNTTLTLGIYRTVIKLSTVHSSITRYTNMLHNETESVHLIPWCAYICRATSTDCGRPVTLKGESYRQYTSNSTAHEWETAENTRQW